MSQPSPPEPSPPPGRRVGPRARTLFAVFGVACVPRLLHTVLTTAGPPTASMFWGYAGNLRNHGVLGHGEAPSTWPDPLYSFFLAGARGLAEDSPIGVAFLQAGVSAAGAVALFSIVNRMSRTALAGWAAAALYAVYPYYVRQSTALLDFALFTTLLILTTGLVIRGRAGAAGAAAGLTVLARSASLPLGIAFGVALLFRRGARSAILYLLVAGLVCVPWYVRNTGVDGSFLPTKGGWNFAKGNCAHTKDVVPDHSVDLLGPYLAERLAAERPELAHATEHARSTYYREIGWRFVTDHPGEAVRQRLANLAYLFSPRLVPYRPSGPGTHATLESGRLVVHGARRRPWMAEILHALSYALLAVAGLGGLWIRRRRWRADLPLLLCLVLLPLTYALGWPGTRLRASIDFVFMAYAGVLVNAIAERRIAASRGPSPESGGRDPAPRGAC